VAEREFLYLTTTGRRSGLQREIEIWYVELEGRYFFLSELRERADWVRNCLTEPRVRFRIGRHGVTMAGRARVVHDATEPGIASTVKSTFAATYGWSDGLIVELLPDARHVTDAPTRNGLLPERG
jgi:deazaflavin-dependent oxidoreductase (nitroreductase family)